jgi:glycoside/pentoside/hexuronide:cation symporter, GPH family
MESQSKFRLDWLRLAIFSSPVLLFQALELPWRIFLTPFFSGTLGIDLAVVAALMMWIRLFDMVADPLVGWASDRFPTRYGLRRPWMVASVPLIMLGTSQVFFALPGTGVAMLALWCVVMHLGYTLMLVPHGGWGLEISGDYHERTRIMGAKVWFAAIGMPLVMLFPAMLEHFGNAGRAAQVAAMGWVLILLAPLSAALVVLAIPEPSIDREAARRTPPPLRQFATILKDRSLVAILVLYALVGLADSSSAGTFVFFVERAIGVGHITVALMLIQAAVAVVALPLWAAASRRLGKRRALAAVFGWNAMLAPLALALPADNAPLLILFLVLRNLSWGADYMLLRAMVADVAGRDAEQGGERKGGSYYALFNITFKLASALGIGVALWLLARAGFQPAEANGVAGIEVVRLTYALPSCLAALAGFVIMLRSRPEASRPAARPALV